MPIEKISAAQALDIRRANGRSTWPTPEKGSEALYPIALPQFSPPFSMCTDDQVFCIGSCFARELEAVLHRHGFSVLSQLKTSENEKGKAGVMNRYSVPAIREEIFSALSRKKQGNSDTDSTRQVFDRLLDADIVVLTLGLSEAWFDCKEQRYLNTLPSPRIIRRDPGRFELHVMSVSETVDMLKASVEMLQSTLRSGVRILLTVSPIPLYCSFRDSDVITANAYSKAVLRSAVEEITSTIPDVAYFPSYEIATVSDYKAVWGQADYRHVDREFVSVIIAHALASLIPNDAEQFETIRDEARFRIAKRLLTTNSSFLRRLERKALERTLSSRKIRKYHRGRDAFFEDSSVGWIRKYGRITQIR